MHLFRIGSFVALLAVSGVIAACTDVIAGSCTEIGCDTVGTSTLQFSFSQPGAYRFELTVDGKAVECTATLPLTEAGSGGCNDDRVRLIQSGSMLPAEQQSIGPIEVHGGQVTRIEARAFRDGVPAGSASYSVEYTLTPGPNGPDCDPKQCRSGSGAELR